MVTRNGVKRPGRHERIVDRDTFKLTLYKNLKKAKTYGIAVGQVGLDTPAGLYTIQNKAENPAWHVPNSAWAGDLAGKVIPGDDPTNPIKARWMGIYDGVGVHGTSDDASIGSRASHGCICMHVPDVDADYRLVLPGYFETLGTRLLHGRVFAAAVAIGVMFHCELSISCLDLFGGGVCAHPQGFIWGQLLVLEARCGICAIVQCIFYTTIGVDDIIQLNRHVII